MVYIRGIVDVEKHENKYKDSKMCLVKTASLYGTVLLLLIGFCTAFYDHDIMLHLAVVFAALGTILPIYDRYSECKKSNRIKTDAQTTAFNPKG